MERAQMKSVLLIIMLSLISPAAQAQQLVSIPLPGHSKHPSADLYGTGHRALILAHGGRFNKESWQPQAKVFADAGFLVLALQFRGDIVNLDGSPSSEGPYPENAQDVVAAIAYLQSIGAQSIAAIGGSLGGDAVGEADALSKPGTIDRIVFLGSSGGEHTADLKGRKLFIVARNDSSGDGRLRLPSITENYNKAPQPKQLVVLEGTAHAQYLFKTETGPRLMKELLRFLTEP